RFEQNIVGVGSKPTLFYNHARKNIRRGRRPCEARRGTRCVRPAPNSSLTLTLAQRAREKTDGVLDVPRRTLPSP
ncbi:MAG TPA: hypothetical protein PK243_09775, partial [Flexilinea sp.]|nr:hypothetical protein [Flexilinea sp.]